MEIRRTGVNSLTGLIRKILSWCLLLKVIVLEEGEIQSLYNQQMFLGHLRNLNQEIPSCCSALGKYCDSSEDFQWFVLLDRQWNSLPTLNALVGKQVLQIHVLRFLCKYPLGTGQFKARSTFLSWSSSQCFFCPSECHKPHPPLC